MKKEISNFLLNLFQDKSFLLELGLSPYESDVFYRLLQGESMRKIAEINNDSIRSIRLIKRKCFHFIPILLRNKIKFFKSSNLESINNKLLELDSILSNYFEFSYNLDKNKKVRELNLSNRTINALSSYGIFKINDLSKVTFEEISKIQNLGKKSLEELEIELSIHNIELKK